ncbi:MAG: hypothetical protein PHR00_01870 [Patescibacteria group bacterium]|nr:hypothetical protein [Patescibacteria group bacterium]
MFNPDQLGQLVRLLLDAENNGVSFDAIKSALQNIQPQTVEVKPEQSAVAITEYTGKVDYSLSIKEAVKAGNYNWVNKYITADNYPVLPGEEGQKDLKFVLVHYNREMSSDNAIAEMNNKLRPATAREFFSFCAKYPDLQRQFPITALGQQWVNIDGFRKVLCSVRYDSDRGLDLISFGYDWPGYYRFLFVCK